jgi:hypothetical protein
MTSRNSATGTARSAPMSPLRGIPCAHARVIIHNGQSPFTAPAAQAKTTQEIMRKGEKIPQGIGRTQFTPTILHHQKGDKFTIG